MPEKLPGICNQKQEKTGCFCTLTGDSQIKRPSTGTEASLVTGVKHLCDERAFRCAVRSHTTVGISSEFSARI